MDALVSKVRLLGPGGNKVVTPSLERRVATTSAPAKKTCGYYNGDPSRQRTAEAGFDCRVDVSRGLWGFCTTTVVSAGDCNFAGACFDRDACLEGCGKLGYTDYPTMMCTSSGFCSTALLDSGRDQTYAHIACGTVQTTETLLAAPTAPLATSTSPPTSVSTSTSPGPSPISSGTAASTTSLPVDNAPPPIATLPQDSTSPPQTTETQSGEAGSTTSNNNKNNNTGAIIGGAIGGLAMICLTSFAIVYMFRRGRRRRSEAKTQQPPEAREFEYNTSSYAEYKTPRYPVELHSSPRAPIYAPAELHG